MSSATPKIVMGRIAAATPLSKMAIFESSVAGQVNAVFAQTSESAKLIKRGDDGAGRKLIGVYCAGDDKTTVYAELRRACGEIPKSEKSA